MYFIQSTQRKWVSLLFFLLMVTILNTSINHSGEKQVTTISTLSPSIVCNESNIKAFPMLYHNFECTIDYELLQKILEQLWEEYYIISVQYSSTNEYTQKLIDLSEKIATEFSRNLQDDDLACFITCDFLFPLYQEIIIRANNLNLAMNYYKKLIGTWSKLPIKFKYHPKYYSHALLAIIDSLINRLTLIPLIFTNTNTEEFEKIFSEFEEEIHFIEELFSFTSEHKLINKNSNYLKDVTAVFLLYKTTFYFYTNQFNKMNNTLVRIMNEQLEHIYLKTSEMPVLFLYTLMKKIDLLSQGNPSDKNLRKINSMHDILAKFTNAIQEPYTKKYLLLIQSIKENDFNTAIPQLESLWKHTLEQPINEQEHQGEYLLAFCYFKIGNKEKAIEALDHFIQHANKIDLFRFGMTQRIIDDSTEEINSLILEICQQANTQSPEQCRPYANILASLDTVYQRNFMGKIKDPSEEFEDHYIQGIDSLNLMLKECITKHQQTNYPEILQKITLNKLRKELQEHFHSKTLSNQTPEALKQSLSSYVNAKLYAVFANENAKKSFLKHIYSYRKNTESVILFLKMVLSLNQDESLQLQKAITTDKDPYRALKGLGLFQSHRFSQLFVSQLIDFFENYNDTILETVLDISMHALYNTFFDVEQHLSSPSTNQSQRLQKGTTIVKYFGILTNTVLGLHQKGILNSNRELSLKYFHKVLDLHKLLVSKKFTVSGTLSTLFVLYKSILRYHIDQYHFDPLKAAECIEEVETLLQLDSKGQIEEKILNQLIASVLNAHLHCAEWCTLVAKYELLSFYSSDIVSQTLHKNKLKKYIKNAQIFYIEYYNKTKKHNYDLENTLIDLEIQQAVLNNNWELAHTHLKNYLDRSIVLPHKFFTVSILANYSEQAKTAQEKEECLRTAHTILQEDNSSLFEKSYLWFFERTPHIDTHITNSSKQLETILISNNFTVTTLSDLYTIVLIELQKTNPNYNVVKAHLETLLHCTSQKTKPLASSIEHLWKQHITLTDFLFSTITNTKILHNQIVDLIFENNDATLFKKGSAWIFSNASQETLEYYFLHIIELLNDKHNHTEKDIEIIEIMLTLFQQYIDLYSTMEKQSHSYVDKDLLHSRLNTLSSFLLQLLDSEHIITSEQTSRIIMMLRNIPSSLLQSTITSLFYKHYLWRSDTIITLLKQTRLQELIPLFTSLQKSENQIIFTIMNHTNDFSHLLQLCTGMNEQETEATTLFSAYHNLIEHIQTLHNSLSQKKYLLAQQALTSLLKIDYSFLPFEHRSQLPQHIQNHAMTFFKKVHLIETNYDTFKQNLDAKKISLHNAMHTITQYQQVLPFPKNDDEELELLEFSEKAHTITLDLFSLKTTTQAKLMSLEKTIENFHYSLQNNNYNQAMTLFTRIIGIDPLYKKLPELCITFLVSTSSGFILSLKEQHNNSSQTTLALPTPILSLGKNILRFIEEFHTHLQVHNIALSKYHSEYIRKFTTFYSTLMIRDTEIVPDRNIIALQLQAEELKEEHQINRQKNNIAIFRYRKSLLCNEYDHLPYGFKVKINGYSKTRDLKRDFKLGDTYKLLFQDTQNSDPKLFEALDCTFQVTEVTQETVYFQISPIFLENGKIDAINEYRQLLENKNDFLVYIQKLPHDPLQNQIEVLNNLYSQLTSLLLHLCIQLFPTEFSNKRTINIDQSTPFDMIYDLICNKAQYHFRNPLIFKYLLGMATSNTIYRTIDPTPTQISFQNTTIEKDPNQLKATLESIDMSSPHPIIAIQGPGGTGKTTIITEIAHQFIQYYKKHKKFRQGLQIGIFVTTQQGADKICQELIKNKITPFNRVGHRGEKIDPYVREHYWDSKKRISILTKAFRMLPTGNGLIYVGTGTGFINDDFLQECEKLIRSNKLFASLFSELNPLHKGFDIIIIDEAAMVSFAEYMVIAKHLALGGKLIIVGDQYQQIPFGITHQHKNDIIDLLQHNSQTSTQRIQEILSDQNLENYRRCYFKTLCEIPTTKVIQLKKVRRAPPIHVQFWEDVCYNGYGLEADMQLHTHNGLLIFKDVQTDNPSEFELNSTPGKKVNPAHIGILLQSIDELLNMNDTPSNKPINTKDISIICPYKAQIQLIQEALISKAILNEEIDLHTLPTRIQNLVTCAKKYAKDYNYPLCTSKKFKKHLTIEDILHLQLSLIDENIDSQDSLGMDLLQLCQQIKGSKSKVNPGVRTLTPQSVQGLQNRVIIIDWVVNNTTNNIYYLGNDIGGTHTATVALTRAQEILINIGNIQTLVGPHKNIAKQASYKKTKELFERMFFFFLTHQSNPNVEFDIIKYSPTSKKWETSKYDSSKIPTLSLLTTNNRSLATAA